MAVCSGKIEMRDRKKGEDESRGRSPHLSNNGLYEVQSCPTWLCRLCGVRPQHPYMTILKELETPPLDKRQRHTQLCCP